ncbi:protein MpNBS-LRR8 [Marchantia polymorpha subsp. ruderalis]|nr:hypothetical protein MARPO_0044s0064 [Marchantia polymorpha]BBN07494.1 hypothetical protein Mp_4g04090 [Marchantia polymorpha subsp. ruderalis]|eukprot:PTQ39606.1 hypothetical protein MARPO_0044s0064 [Marchantia polymorpha]
MANENGIVDEERPVQHENGKVDRMTSKMKQLPPENLQKLDQKAVGVYTLVESVIPEVMQTNAILGLWGMGGAGKTTLAKLLFNKLSPKFEYSCFVSDAKLIDGKAEELRTRVKTHMHHRGQPMSLADVEGEWKQIQEKKLILVLDDVANEHDVQILNDIARESCVDESRYIVTSRHESLLNKLDDVCIYQVPLLDGESAESLFMSYAFPGRREPSSTLRPYVDQVVQKCEGLPLTLEILGKYLGRNNDEKTWKHTLQGLAEAEKLTGDEKLWAQLKLSYDSLDHKEKEMFLDVAAFFVESQYTLREAKCAWDILYEDTLEHWQNLLDLSLVYRVDDHRTLKMHHQLKALGRRIALTSGIGGKASRIWKPQAAFKLLNSPQQPETIGDDVEEIVTLRIDWSRGPDFAAQDDEVIWKNLRRMKELQYLDCSSKIELNEDSEFPPGLVLLSWRGVVTELPFDPALHDSLVVFKLDASRGQGKSNVRGLDYLPHNFGLLSSLRILELTRCSFDSLPDSFGQLCKLRRLKIADCDKLMTLPETFGKLSKLEYLEINCHKMHALPVSFGKLSHLEELFLHHCSFQIVPDTFCNLLRLRVLEMRHCGKLSTLPKKIGHLSSLQRFMISHCKTLRTLSENFGPFSSLTFLAIMYCDQLEKFPESLPSKLKEVKLYISGCPQIEKLPEALGRLVALDHLKVRLVCRLKALPESFGHLVALNHLEIDDCSRLEKLPESFGHMMSLNHLEIKRCHRIEILPESFGQLSGLAHLKIDDCSKLNALPESFGTLSSLEHLEIDDCNELETLPESFGQLLSLTHLRIRDCSKLRSLPDSFGGLVSLRTFEICDCYSLKAMPESFGNLPALKYLEISTCFNLVKLSLGNLKALKHLHITDCSVLQKLADSLERLRALKNLSISKCFKLDSLPELPESLERLVVEWVPLNNIPECIQRLPNLRTLELKALPFLTRVPEWLPNVTPPVEQQSIFRVQEGKFIMEVKPQAPEQPAKEEMPAHERSDIEWRLRVLEISDMQAFYQLKYGYKGLVTGKYDMAMDMVRAKNYEQALVHLNALLHMPQFLAKSIEFEESDDHKYTLRDINIVKRLMAGDPKVCELMKDFGSTDLSELIFTKAKEAYDSAMAKLEAHDPQGAFDQLDSLISLFQELNLMDLLEDYQYEEFLTEERARVTKLLV